jgi:hypothetical protein
MTISAAHGSPELWIPEDVHHACNGCGEDFTDDVQVTISGVTGLDGTYILTRPSGCNKTWINTSISGGTSPCNWEGLKWCPGLNAQWQLSVCRGTPEATEDCYLDAPCDLWLVFLGPSDEDLDCDDLDTTITTYDANPLCTGLLSNPSARIQAA